MLKFTKSSLILLTTWICIITRFSLVSLVTCDTIINTLESSSATTDNYSESENSVNSNRFIGENVVTEFIITSQNVELFKRSDSDSRSSQSNGDTSTRKPKLYSWWMPNMTMGGQPTQSSKPDPIPTKVLTTLQPPVIIPNPTKTSRPTKTCKTLETITGSNSESSLSTSTPKNKLKLYSWWMPNMTMGGQLPAASLVDQTSPEPEPLPTESLITTTQKPTRKPRPTKRPPRTKRPTQATSTVQLDPECITDEPIEQTTTPVLPLITIKPTPQTTTTTASAPDSPSTTNYGIKRKFVKAVKTVGKVAVKAAGAIAIGASGAGPIIQVVGKVASQAGSLAVNTAIKVAPVAKDVAKQASLLALSAAGQAGSFTKNAADRISKKISSASQPETGQENEKDRNTENPMDSNGDKKDLETTTKRSSMAQPEKDMQNENNCNFAISNKVEFLIIFVTFMLQLLNKLLLF